MRPGPRFKLRSTARQASILLVSSELSTSSSACSHPKTVHLKLPEAMSCVVGSAVVSVATVSPQRRGKASEGCGLERSAQEWGGDRVSKGARPGTGGQEPQPREASRSSKSCGTTEAAAAPPHAGATIISGESSSALTTALQPGQLYLHARRRWCYRWAR